MNKINGFISKPLNAVLTGAALGFLVGMIIGLPLLGWWLWPVQYTDADITHLRPDLKADYTRMMVESYKKTGDKQTAISRFKGLGTDGAKFLADLQKDLKTSADAVEFGQVVGSGVGPAKTPAATAKPGEPSKAPQATLAPAATLKPMGTQSGGGVSENLMWLLGIFCFLTLIIGGALFYLLVVRKNRKTTSGTVQTRQPAAVSKENQVETAVAEAQEQPVAQFMTTYMIGDDLYDDSFSIDSPSGEFLGECGVGISEAIGVGEPKKVTAYEIWLFDKNDIQTVTKVLMSENAFNDPVISSRLASKGEPVLIEAGKKVMLQTATLQLEARLVDASYGQGALPANSFFERMALELAVWPKPKA